MTHKRRLQKLTDKLKPEATKIYYMGWADCTWSESEGLFRRTGEPKEAFCERVYKNTKKQYLWFY